MSAQDQVLHGFGADFQSAHVPITKQQLESLKLVYFRLIAPITYDEFEKVCKPHIPFTTEMRRKLEEKHKRDEEYFMAIYADLNDALTNAYRSMYRDTSTNQSVSLHHPSFEPGEKDILIAPRACMKYGSQYFKTRTHPDKESCILYFLSNFALKTGTSKEVPLCSPFYTITKQAYEKDRKAYMAALHARGKDVAESMVSRGKDNESRIKGLNPADLGTFSKIRKRMLELSYGGDPAGTPNDPDAIPHIFEKDDEATGYANLRAKLVLVEQ